MHQMWSARQEVDLVRPILLDSACMCVWWDYGTWGVLFYYLL